MSTTRVAKDVFNADFLAIRHHLLNVAAGMDRVGRAADVDEVADDPRWRQIHEAIDALTASKEDRAENVQMIFSRPYDPEWR